MQVLSGKHRGHAAKLDQLAGDRLAADCANCKAGISLSPSQVMLTGAEVARLRENYENFARGGRRESAFWRNWQLADGGVLARRWDAQ